MIFTASDMGDTRISQLLIKGIGRHILMQGQYTRISDQRICIVHVAGSCITS